MRYLLLSFFACFAQPLLAETVRVQSGEHADFTRIVVDLAQRSDWDFSETDDGYELKIADEDLTFDAETVFDLIPKTRLMAVTAGPQTGRLSFQLASNMVAATATELPGGVVVIDFTDAPPKPEPPQESLPPITQKVLGAREQMDFYWRDVAPLLSDVAQEPAAAEAASEAKTEVNIAAPPDLRLAEAEAQLLEQLSRAASQGLVSIDMPEPKVPQPTPEPPSVELSEPSPPKPEANTLGVHAETAIDRDAVAPYQRQSFSVDGVQCLPDPIFDLASWRSDAPPLQQISDARLNLVGEFDRAEERDVVKLARLYLSIGFGAEAIAVLKAFPPESTQHKAMQEPLRYMSAIIEGAVPDQNSRINEMLDCDSSAALWALLGRTEIPPARPVRYTAVQRSFAALPTELRLHLAEPLIQKLLSIGANDVAKVIRNSAGRVDPEDSRLSMADARLELAAGDETAARERLEAASNANSTTAIEALMLLIDAKLAAGEAVDQRVIDNVEALTFEHSKGPDGPRLTRAFILSAGSAQLFDKAFAALGSLPESSARSALALELFAQLVKAQKDVDFLGNYLEHEAEFRALATDFPLRANVAERLVANGFADAAAAALGADPLATERGRLVMANTALLKRAPETALRYLEPSDSADAQVLRARAYSQLNDQSAAIDAFSAVGDSDAAAKEAWKSGDWETISRIGNEEQKQAVSTLGLGAPEVNAAPPDAVSLGASRALLEESKKKREALNAILADKPVETPAETPAAPPNATPPP